MYRSKELIEESIASILIDVDATKLESFGEGASLDESSPVYECNASKYV